MTSLLKNDAISCQLLLLSSFSYEEFPEIDHANLRMTADGQIKQSPGESIALSQFQHPRQSHKGCPIRNISPKCPNGSELSKVCPIRRKNVYQLSVTWPVHDHYSWLYSNRVEKGIFLTSTLPVKAIFRPCWVLKALTE